MTRITLLATALCMLSACAGPARQPSSALDAVDAPLSKLRPDCQPPPPGFVCVREVRPDADGKCHCLGADRLHTLGIWPDSYRP